ncbi:hypothetical protein E5790_00870 [Stenotrophomonas sp. PAMC25021]|nr:hypothetical protein E5790_00870 [Stenotrophomonas sp. PAMC25021]QGL84224.1 hypothetical protein FEO93_08560 [Stenotrophomonas maltophilia]
MASVMSHWLSDGGIGYLFRASPACWWCPAGLRPAPAVVPAAGRQPQQQLQLQLPASRGMAGRARLRGTP